MLKKIKEWLFGDRNVIIPSDYPLRPIEKTTQEDSGPVEMRMRINQAMREQHVDERALKPHGADCKDPLECKRAVCWKWEPDNIVGKPYNVTKKVRRRDYGIVKK